VSLVPTQNQAILNLWRKQIIKRKPDTDQILQKANLSLLTVLVMGLLNLQKAPRRKPNLGVNQNQGAAQDQEKR